MADYIPLKLQAEIMKRLPVISLIRFRTVSKQWKSLIDSAKFIADHHVIQDHTQSQHHHRHLLLSCMERVASWGSVVRYSSIVDDDTFPHQKVFMTTPASVNLRNYSILSLVGVSGGLFCICSSIGLIKRAVIWNPSIKKTITIVVPNDDDDDVVDDDDDHDLWYYKTIVGFGVCPRTSDPKLVKITFNYMYRKEYATIPNQVEVFSLSSGSWKRPSGKLPRKSIQYMYPQVAINEFIYWLAYDMRSWDWKYQYCHLIMSFDLTSEEFTEVYLPQNLASSKADVYISKLNESLVVLEKNHAFNANLDSERMVNP
ncbi:putative F-box domain-containing protein [Tanacetum coccineum]